MKRGLLRERSRSKLCFIGDRMAVHSLTICEARVYNGSGITPAVVVTLDGKKLVKETDYVIDYIQNVNVGTATIRLTGCGNYVGTVKKTFKILPRGTAVRALTPEKKAFSVRWDKQDMGMKTFHITGYQIQYSTSITQCDAWRFFISVPLFHMLFFHND